MPYTLIKGSYIIFYPGESASGQPKPDGDTIKFIPANPQTLGKLNRLAATCIDFSSDFKFSVRFEGIDAL